MRCVFCQRDVPLTAEHVMPQWTKPYLEDPAGGSGTHTRWRLRAGATEAEQGSRRGGPATQTVRAVCPDCNNGWMSRLEGQAKPYLESMLRGNRRMYHASGQTLIASWFVKTALVAGAKARPPLRSEFYDEIRAAGRPSEHTRVWLAATPWKYMHYSDIRPLTVHDADEPPPDLPNAYSSVLALGHAVGFVVSWLDDEPPLSGVLPKFEDALVPVWPRTEGTSTWPPRSRLDHPDRLDDLADAIVRAPQRLAWPWDASDGAA